MILKKNKGFSLIEVVVAVAILTLLMAPIITQVAQTLRTSSQAKERQYAVENAELILNTFQEMKIEDVKKLKSGVSIGEDIMVSNNPVTSAQTCEVYVIKRYNEYFNRINISGSESYSYAVEQFRTLETPIGIEQVPNSPEEGAANNIVVKNKVSLTGEDEDRTGQKVSVDYDLTTYILKSIKQSDGVAKIGKHKYTRKVLVDNLNSQLLRNQLAIETHFTEGQKRTLRAAGYTINTEGAAVKTVNGVITGIVCTEIESLKDPNGLGISYLADLDDSKVAIIQNSTANLDKQAVNAFYNLNMDKLRGKSEKEFTEEITKDDNVTSTFSTGPVNKMTKITINSGYDTELEDGKAKGKYYLVECTVYYEGYFDESGAPDMLSYPVYKQKFYTRAADNVTPRAPLIYFVYEPYVADGKRYVDNDFILTYDGIAYENSTDPGDERTKLYMICNPYPEVLYDGDDGVLISADDSRFFRTTAGTMEGTSGNVNVYLDYLDDGDSSPIQIFTNIAHREKKEGTETDPVYFDDMSLSNFRREGVSWYPTYNVDYSSSTDTTKKYRDTYYSVYSSSKTGLIDTGSASSSGVSREQYPVMWNYDGSEEGGYDTFDHDKEDTIYDLDQDKMYSDRLFTVTVQLDRTDETDGGNSVRLTGAKGAE